jgi:hypothetical protein
MAVPNFLLSHMIGRWISQHGPNELVALHNDGAYRLGRWVTIVQTSLNDSRNLQVRSTHPSLPVIASLQGAETRDWSVFSTLLFTTIDVSWSW